MRSDIEYPYNLLSLHAISIIKNHIKPYLAKFELFSGSSVKIAFHKMNLMLTCEHRKQNATKLQYLHLIKRVSIP